MNPPRVRYGYVWLGSENPPPSGSFGPQLGCFVRSLTDRIGCNDSSGAIGLRPCFTPRRSHPPQSGVTTSIHPGYRFSGRYVVAGSSQPGPVAGASDSRLVAREMQRGQKTSALRFEPFTNWLLAKRSTATDMPDLSRQDASSCRDSADTAPTSSSRHWKRTCVKSTKRHCSRPTREGLARAIEEGSTEARERMVRANLRLVVNIARGYTGKGLAAARPHRGRQPRPPPRASRASTRR